MGLFGKKEKEEIPSLPELPETNELVLPSKDDLPDVPPGLPEIETSNLPGLPTIEVNEMPQQQIKNAISSPGELAIPNSQVPAISAPPQAMQKSKFEITKSPQQMKNQSLPRTIEIEPGKPMRNFERPATQKAEPVYIRLDKFEVTVSVFEEIKNKITEIEESLIKTKEIKQKEEEELIEWEREIQMIKTKIDSIDKNIFNKLD
jgi:hypothetical protein